MSAKTKKMLVVATQEIARHVKKLLGKEWEVVSVGQNVMGYHVDTILITRHAVEINRGHPLLYDKFQKWIDKSLMCRIWHVDENGKPSPARSRIFYL